MLYSIYGREDMGKRKEREGKGGVVMERMGKGRSSDGEDGERGE